MYPMSDEMEIAKSGLLAGRVLYGFMALRSMTGGDLGNCTYLSGLGLLLAFIALLLRVYHLQMVIWTLGNQP